MENLVLDGFEEKFTTFYDGVRKIYLDYMAKNYPNNKIDEMSYTVGGRYVKVIREGSVHLFVDKKTGDVLKAASWAAPAKGARGNIFDEHNGLSRINAYGAEYNR